jgi:hypothetical protein
VLPADILDEQARRQEAGEDAAGVGHTDQQEVGGAREHLQLLAVGGEEAGEAVTLRPEPGGLPVQDLLRGKKLREKSKIIYN